MGGTCFYCGTPNCRCQMDDRRFRELDGIIGSTNINPVTVNDDGHYITHPPGGLFLAHMGIYRSDGDKWKFNARVEPLGARAVSPLIWPDYVDLVMGKSEKAADWSDMASM